MEQSVPLYHEGHELVCQLSDFFVHDGSRVTELGTFTGALVRGFLAHNARRTDLVDVTTVMKRVGFEGFLAIK